MKKLLSMIACLALVLTMFAGMTVLAADADITLQNYAYLEYGGNPYVQVEVKYSVPDTYEEYTYEEDMFSGDITNQAVVGLTTLNFVVESSDASFTPYAAAKVNASGLAISKNSTNNGGNFTATAAADYYTKSEEAVIAKLTFAVADTTKGTTLSFVADETYMEVIKVEADAKVWTHQYKGNNGTLTLGSIEIPAKEVPASDYNVTYAEADYVVWGDKPATTTDGSVTFSVKPAMGYTIAVTANGESVTVNAAEGGEITIDDIAADTNIVVTATPVTNVVTYPTVVNDAEYGYIVFGKAPAGAADFGVELDGTAYAAKKWASNNAFGIGFKGLEVGKYAANAYADGAKGDTVNIVVE